MRRWRYIHACFVCGIPHSWSWQTSRRWFLCTMYKYRLVCVQSVKYDVWIPKSAEDNHWILLENAIQFIVLFIPICHLRTLNLTVSLIYYHLKLSFVRHHVYFDDSHGKFKNSIEQDERDIRTQHIRGRYHILQYALAGNIYFCFFFIFLRTRESRKGRNNKIW